MNAHSAFGAWNAMFLGPVSSGAPTLADVAKLAGVSQMTASRALNGGPVKDATKHKVEAAARSLRYRPNEVARALARRRLGM